MLIDKGGQDYWDYDCDNYCYVVYLLVVWWYRQDVWQVVYVDIVGDDVVQIVEQFCQIRFDYCVQYWKMIFQVDIVYCWFSYFKVSGNGGRNGDFVFIVFMVGDDDVYYGGGLCDI